MAVRVNPKLIDDLEVFGAEDVSKCYHCGNCSATCPSPKSPTSSRGVRCACCRWAWRRSWREPRALALLLLGECTDDCPRDAEPGETMMSLRRWLTSRYDWTGISRLFYRSGKLN